MHHVVCQVAIALRLAVDGADDRGTIQLAERVVEAAAGDVVDAGDRGRSQRLIVWNNAQRLSPTRRSGGPASKL